MVQNNSIGTTLMTYASHCIVSTVTIESVYGYNHEVGALWPMPTAHSMPVETTMDAETSSQKEVDRRRAEWMVAEGKS